MTGEYNMLEKIVDVAALISKKVDITTNDFFFSFSFP